MALRKIAAAADVSLDWLITGIGSPDDDGILAASRKEEKRHATNVQEDAEFEAGMSKALRRITKGSQQASSQHSSASIDNPTLNLRRRIMREVRAIYMSSEVTVHDDEIAIAAMDVVLTLSKQVRDMTDDKEVDLALAQILHNLERDLSQAAAEPGNGKRSA